MLSYRFRISSYFQIVNIFLGLYNIEFVEKFLLSLISIRRMVHEYHFFCFCYYTQVFLCFKMILLNSLNIHYRCNLRYDISLKLIIKLGYRNLNESPDISFGVAIKLHLIAFMKLRLLY